MKIKLDFITKVFYHFKVMEVSKNKKPNIGFLINQFFHTYQSMLWKFSVEVCREKNANLLFFLTRTLLSPYPGEISYNSIYQLAKNKRLDCIVLGNVVLNFLNSEEVKELIEELSPIPIITFGTKLEGIPTVIVDGRYGITQAVGHLYNIHKCRNIAFIKGPDDLYESEERLKGYIEGLNKVNLSFEPEYIGHGDFSRKSGFDAAFNLIEKKGLKPDAIICSNDEMAIGVIDFLEEKNISVPEDIKLIGFDNVEESKFSNPPLTTIEQPLRKQLEIVIESAINLINKEKIPEILTLPATLIVRESCGCISEDTARENHFLDYHKIKSLYSLKMTGDYWKFQPDTFGLFHDEMTKRSWMEDVKTRMEEELELRVLANFNLFTKEVAKIFYKYTEEAIARRIDFRFIYSFLMDYLHKKKEADESIKAIIDRAIAIIEKIYSETEKRVLLNIIVEQREKRLFLEMIGQEISSAFNKKRLVELLKRFLPSLGIKKCFLCLYQGNVEWNGKLKWVIPEKAKILLDFREGDISVCENKFITKEEFLPEDFFKGESFNGAVLPLFFENSHFGYMVFSPLSEDEILFETLQRQISNAINGALLIESIRLGGKRLKNALKELKKYQKRLEELATIDELTGLYNRRGFLNFANRLLELSKRKQRTFVLFFFDLDWLKEINDNFGHKEGDEAIIAAANIIKKSFRQTDVIARIGGDEIAVLAIDCTMKEVRNIKERLIKNLEEYNQKSNKPYIISLSYGIAPYISNTFSTLDDLIREADKNLYEKKLENKSRMVSVFKSLH